MTQPVPGVHENFAGEAAMSADKETLRQLEDTLERTIALDVATMSPAMRDRYRTALAQAGQPVAVKPLEWRKEATWAQAQCPVFGTVSVFLRDGRWDWSLHIVNCASRSSTIEEAIDELEEERERRVISALAHPPAKREAGETAPPQTRAMVSGTPSAAFEFDDEVIAYAQEIVDDREANGCKVYVSDVIDAIRAAVEASHE